MKNINSIYQNDSVYNNKFCNLELLESKIEGDINSEFVVFYDTAENLVLEENQKQFLMKMLGAVKHEVENTLIIDSKTGVKFKQLLEKGNVKRIIFFGSTRKSVGLNLSLKRYKIFNIQGVECLFVDNLEILIDDNKRKSALWSLMKQMFDIA